MSIYTTQLMVGGTIGSGYFGHVFEGNCQLNGKVAIKLLLQKPGESNADWALRSKTLIEEAQKLKSAQHRNVVVVNQVVLDPNGVVHRNRILQ